jgi:hypothetical protein
MPGLHNEEQLPFRESLETPVGVGVLCEMAASLQDMTTETEERTMLEAATKQHN